MITILPSISPTTRRSLLIVEISVLLVSTYFNLKRSRITKIAVEYYQYCYINSCDFSADCNFASQSPSLAKASLFYHFNYYIYHSKSSQSTDIYSEFSIPLKGLLVIATTGSNCDRGYFINAEHN